MSIKVLKPGTLTTIQDTGRYGLQKNGIIAGGAMDSVALRIANLLVGNAESAAAIEATLTGPHLYFDSDQVIAITGANMSPTINGAPVNMWRPVFVRKGNSLRFGTPLSGARTYVAVSGSFDIPEVMGSFGTYLRAGVGGFKGRPLQAGDMLPCHELSDRVSPLLEELQVNQFNGAFKQARWKADPHVYPANSDKPVIRVTRGPEYNLLSELSRIYLWKEKYQVMPQSDRMGYQLLGVTLSITQKEELISSAVTFGTIQVPPKGNLIVLMADRQTIGGYPRIAQVITADLPVLAQVPPGKIIRFAEVSLEAAQQLYLQQEYYLEQFRQGLEFKFKR